MGEGAVTAVVSTERRYRRHQGGLWGQGAEDHAFFQRYLDVFDRVLVVARVADGDPLPGSRRVDGAGVSVVGLPSFVGARGLIGSLAGSLRELRRIDSGRAVWILRVPGAVAALCWVWLQATGTRFALEVTTDPTEEYTADAYGGGRSGVLQRTMATLLGVQCRQALGTAYVTETALQTRFPPGNRLTTHYSSIDLPDATLDRSAAVSARIAAGPRRLRSARLVFVGNLGRPLKGLDVLLHALSEPALSAEGFLLDVVGDGALRGKYEALAARLGVAPRVRFLGYVPGGDQVYDRMQRADVLVLPSRREGLPRVVIEGMALGLPVVSTDVSGARELLSERWIVPKNDPPALARAVAEMLDDGDARLEASRRNAHRARDYARSSLRERRRRFYAALRARSHP